MPAAVDRVLHTMEPVRALARELAGKSCVLFLGRHVGYPVALEGALKLKELAYMHAEGFAAGELKHGPIALIEEGMPVVVVVPSPRGRSLLHDKSCPTSRRSGPAGRARSSSPRRATRRSSPTPHIIRVPAVPTLLRRWSPRCRCRSSPANWPGRGLDVDQPRNLAKSVTVE